MVGCPQVRALFEVLAAGRKDGERAMQRLFNKIGVIGALDEDHGDETQVRLTKILEFFSLPSAKWQIAITFMVTKIIDQITRVLMGAFEDGQQRKQSGDPSRLNPLTLQEVLDMVSDVQEKLYKLIEDFYDSESDMMFLLASIGVTKEELADPKLARYLRRLVLHMSDGVDVRLARLLCSPEYVLAAIAYDDCTGVLFFSVQQCG